MTFVYYTLSYRKLYCRHGDPEGFDRTVYLQTTDRSKCEELAKKYSLHLVDQDDLFSDGFEIYKHVIEVEEVADESGLAERAKAEAERWAGCEEDRMRRELFNYFISVS